MQLIQKKCLPCDARTPKLSVEQVQTLAQQVPLWHVIEETEQPPKIQRHFKFPDFVAAVGFINRVAALAEAEAHHPDLFVSYSKVDVTLWTHAIGGLSENDFILAAKIDRLEDQPR